MANRPHCKFIHLNIADERYWQTQYKFTNENVHKLRALIPKTAMVVNAFVLVEVLRGSDKMRSPKVPAMETMFQYLRDNLPENALLAVIDISFHNLFRQVQHILEGEMGKGNWLDRQLVYGEIGVEVDVKNVTKKFRKTLSRHFKISKEYANIRARDSESCSYSVWQNRSQQEDTNYSEDEEDDEDEDEDEDDEE